jgi:hypothetical protein
VLSDSEKAFSGAPVSTCTYGGAFKMLRDLTDRLGKFLEQQRLREQLDTSVQLCRRLSAIFSQQWILGPHYHKAFHVSDSSLLE